MMFLKIVLMLSLIIVTQKVSAQKAKIDSVICSHFLTLDSAISLLNRNDDLLLECDYHSSMFLLERVSRVKADRKHDYSAAPILTEELIAKWRKWFNNYYDKLIWVEDKINRTDYDIYTGRIKPVNSSMLTSTTTCSKELPGCLE